MENELFYFFSTLAQVLAAIIALVFVFILFKLQNFDKEIAAFCRSFASTLGSNVTSSRTWQNIGSGSLFMDKFLSQDFYDISSLMHTVCNERENDNKNLVQKLKGIANNVSKVEKEKQKLINKIKHLTIVSFFVIVGSLSIIPIVKFINVSYLFTISLMLIFILLLIFILIKVFFILSKSLN